MVQGAPPGLGTQDISSPAEVKVTPGVGFGTQQVGTVSETPKQVKDYGLRYTFSNIPAELHQDLIEALQRAEKRLTPQTVIHSWREILIVVLIIASVFFFWRWNENAKALATAQELAARVKIVEQIEAKLDDMKKREELLYPELRERISSVDANLAGVRKQIKAIKIPDPKDYQAQAQRKTLDEISRSLLELGYPNEVK